MELDEKRKDELLKTAMNDLRTSSEYKKKRFIKIREAQDMMLGKVKPRFRTQFNVPLPVLSGMYDQLCADLDDPIQLKVKNSPGKNLNAVKGINLDIDIERKSLRTTSRWDYKDRMGKKHAVAYGRAIYSKYSEGSPYRSILNVVNPEYFHCQPRGGGLLETHLFKGEEGIRKTKSNLMRGVKEGIYEAEGVQTLIARAGDKNYMEKLKFWDDDMNARFRALGLDPQANNYVGEVTWNLSQFIINKWGQEWYILFDPFSNTRLRVCPLEEISAKGIQPYVSYATHEDDEMFWSLSILADILYPIADSIHTLFNQDLTNRQKQNLNARAYDRDMFKNLAKLDEAQSRPDALVPADTMGGTKKIGDGIYAFTTPVLTGTVDMINWLTEFTSQQSGAYQPNPPKQGSGKSQTNNIVFMEIQQLQKRIDYRSHGYCEAWGEIILRHVAGLQENMSQPEAIQRLGIEVGYSFKIDLKDIKLDRDDIEILSTKEQAAEDALKKQQKNSALTAISSNPILSQRVNPDWLARHTLMDVGGWEKDEVEDALDLRGMGGEHDQLAQAQKVIKQILKGETPEPYWNATTIFQRYIIDFTKKYKDMLEKQYGKDKPIALLKYVTSVTPIANQNVQELVARLKAASAGQPQQGGQQGQQQGQPQRKPAQRSPQVGMKQQGQGFVQGGQGPNANAGQPTPTAVSMR